MSSEESKPLNAGGLLSESLEISAGVILLFLSENRDMLKTERGYKLFCECKEVVDRCGTFEETKLLAELCEEMGQDSDTSKPFDYEAFKTKTKK